MFNREENKAMRIVHVAGASFAVVMALSMAGFAQEPAQPRTPAPAQEPAQPRTPAPAPATPAPAPQQQDRSKADAQAITLVGCVQSESDFRTAQDAGKGGVAGTGIGAGNEFVLINAAMAPAGAPGGDKDKPTGTAGVAAGTSSYELTGPNEGQVANHVGKRVEIVGTLKPAEVGAAGPTGGPTAGAPPRGVDVASSDLKLRELDVISVREASGACPASK
jgi:hypothetical protein